MEDHLERFLEAHQDAYQHALEEVRNGLKQTHWMWFIFPQIKGLGQSYLAQYFAIENIEEASAYLHHPILGNHLHEICDVLLNLNQNDPVRIFGSVDAMKLKSSMTLFACISEKDSLFQQILNQYYHGERDSLTLNLLNR